MLTTTETNPELWDARDRLRYTLDHWQDIWDVSVSNSQPKNEGGRSSGTHTPSLPPMAKDRGVCRIEAALTVLADHAPVSARHLKAYRCNAEWRTRDELVLVKLPSGRNDLQERRKSERIVPEWVSPAKVAEAELLLLHLLKHDVSVPRDLWKAAQ